MSEMTPTPPAPGNALPPANVCTWSADPVAYLGAPCSTCGHTSLAHPGPTNPALVECILCRVEVSVDDLVAWCGVLEETVEAQGRHADALEAQAADFAARLDALEARA